MLYKFVKIAQLILVANVLGQPKKPVTTVRLMKEGNVLLKGVDVVLQKLMMAENVPFRQMVRGDVRTFLYTVEGYVNRTMEYKVPPEAVATGPKYMTEASV